MYQKYFTEEDRKKARRTKQTASAWQRRQNPEVRTRASELRKIMDPIRRATISGRSAHHCCKARARAKLTNKEIDIDRYYLESIYTGYCSLTGSVLDLSSTIKKSTNSPSLDRIDTTKGYTKNNVWWVSDHANTLKGGMTPSMMIVTLEKLGYTVSK